VVEGTAGTTGEAFFRSLTRHLALALELRYCFATRCLDAPPTRVATLAFWDGERYVDNFEYDLWGTPCEEVMAGRDRVFIRDVQKLFPDDRDLVDLDAESYAAVPLQGSSGRVIGHLAVLDTQPLDEAGPELPILRIFAARAAAELERQRATARLERSERRYRQFFEEDISGNFVATPEGRILSCNPAFARLFGFPSKEAVLQDPDWDLTVAADDHPETLARLTREGRLERHERTYRRRDGRPLYAIENLAARFEDGRPVEIRGYLLDLTELKRLEQHFLQAQRMEAVGQLAGGIAHDFNNLLTAILGFGRMLELKLAAHEAARRDCREMLKAAQRAADLTGQLLAFSRRQVLHPREVDLGEVVRGMERMLRQLLGENVELLTSLDPDLEKVTVDPGRIEQVLVTLALNARDAMPTGGRMTLRTGHLQVDPGPLADDLELTPGRYVSLAVSDTGVGIDPGLRDKIFEPFFTTKDHGTGLGLASVYGIVRQSGGAVRVESRPGEGTTFTVLVPLPQQEGGTLPAAPEEAATAPAPRGELDGSETVLVVEDQPELRQLLALMLGHRGYRVLTAGDAEGALAVAERHDGNVDLLLTDVVLPGPSGRELADRLLAERPGTRVIYMSGYTDEVVLRHGVEEGSLTFVQKPFDEKTLLGKVRQLLDHSERSAPPVDRCG